MSDERMNIKALAGVAAISMLNGAVLSVVYEFGHKLMIQARMMPDSSLAQLSKEGLVIGVVLGVITFAGLAGYSYYRDWQKNQAG